MKMLIVDDEPNIRQMMRMTLETSGDQVIEASDGEEALARFGDARGFDLVVLDERMPGIDGLETLRRIKQRAARTPVLMVTAYGSIELAVTAMKLGATDFLRKPMTPDALRSAVAAALANRDAHPSTDEPVPVTPPIQMLTMNGFQLTPVESGSPTEHAFRVRHFKDGFEANVRVVIDSAAIGRVERLTHRRLEPHGAFWRIQAERLLSSYLWTEGKLPPGGALTVTDVSRDDLDAALGWTGD